LIVLLAGIFLTLHLPYLPRSLEDLDSINFALGVRQFDVAHHQPHPPGYPVYMFIAKAVYTAVPDEARALGLVSVLSGGLGVLAIAATAFAGFLHYIGIGRNTVNDEEEEEAEHEAKKIEEEQRP